MLNPDITFRMAQWEAELHELTHSERWLAGRERPVDAARASQLERWLEQPWVGVEEDSTHLPAPSIDAHDTADALISKHWSRLIEEPGLNNHCEAWSKGQRAPAIRQRLHSAALAVEYQLGARHQPPQPFTGWHEGWEGHERRAVDARFRLLIVSTIGLVTVLTVLISLWMIHPAVAVLLAATVASVVVFVVKCATCRGRLRDMRETLVDPNCRRKD